MSYPFCPPVTTSTGGAGSNGAATNAGSGRVAVAAPVWPTNRPFPWPYPNSATQGAVGGAGGVGTVSVQRPPYYGPYQPYFPYAVPDQWYRGLPNNPLRS